MKENVELTKESVDFLRSLADKISTQDNLATAKPYFIVIRKLRWRVAHGEYNSGETKNVWVDTADGDYREWESPKEYAVNLIQECGFTAKEARCAVWDNLEEFVMERYVEEENVFLTHEAYSEHLRLNGHNLGKRGEDYHSFLKHAFRNPEMSGLFKAIAEFGVEK